LSARHGVLFGGAAASASAATTASATAAFLILIALTAASASTVGSAATLAGNLTPLFRIHRCETASATPTTAATTFFFTAFFALIFAFVITAAATVGGATAHAGDFPLLFRVHRGETASAAATATTASFFVFAFAFVFAFVIAATSAVGSATAHAGDFPLLFRVHRCEAACALAMTVGLLAVAVCDAAVAFALILFAGFVMLGGPSMVVGRAFVVERGVAVVAREPPLATDFGHVLPVAAHSAATFGAGFGGFFRIKFMSRAAFVCRAAAHARDFALFFRIHRCKSPIASTSHLPAPWDEMNHDGLSA
jgi:hypothetical protein